MNLKLKSILKGKTIIIGIGNSIRGDDGVGPELIKELNNSQLSILRLYSGQALNYQLILLDAGEVPENYLGKVTKLKPDTILLVDAVDFGREPGSTRIIDTEFLSEGGLSTHNASLKLSIEYLKKETGANIFLLGIQPQNITMGSEISYSVEKKIKEIKEELTRCMN